MAHLILALMIDEPDHAPLQGRRRPTAFRLAEKHRTDKATNTKLETPEGH
ncbi:hypothetical protein [Mesorhizobium sp. M0898]